MFTGASALAAALAIEDKANGKVVTFDVSDTHLELARTHWKMAGVDHMIDFKAPPYFALILVLRFAGMSVLSRIREFSVPGLGFG